MGSVLSTSDKEKFWGFYGQRITICRKAKQGSSYEHLFKLMEKHAKKDYFIITQNDHGFLQKQGFPEDKIWELYGNINYF